tara:strand:+ start:3494 stop:4204 length:711 start_codon:yes stop_codon:yes gene_type:complete
MKSFKEYILIEQHEITVGGYTTKHFYMCGSAQEVMKKNSDLEGAEELTKLQDMFYKMEREVLDAGESTDEQKKQAKDLYNQIMKKAGEIGLADDIAGFMKQHLDSVLKGDPKPGFGRTDLDEALTPVQRRKRAMVFKKNKAKIAMGRRKAAKKPKSKEKLKKLARKMARKLLIKKMIKDRNYSTLSFGEKQKIEKRLDKLGPVIDRISKKLLPKVRIADKERIKKLRGSAPDDENV